MTDLGELYLLFVILYLFECVVWVPRRAVGFYRWAGRWRARAAFRPNSGWSLSVVLGKPWPPLSPPWFAEPLPFALDPDGITLVEADQRRLPWEALGRFEARGHRLEAGPFSVTTGSRNAAAWLASTLERLRTMPATKREAELRGLFDHRYDVALPGLRGQRYAETVRTLRVLSMLLWLSLFGGLGIAVLSRNLLVLLIAAGLSVVLWPANAFAFVRCLRKLDWLAAQLAPEPAKRWVAILSPISGVRAADLLAREVWADVEPLAAAAELLSPTDLAAFARPLLVAFDARSDDGLAWWRAENRQRIERVLGKRGIHAGDVLAEPARENDRVQRYCPACLAQFAAGSDALSSCPNESCAGVSLRPFSKERTS